MNNTMDVDTTSELIPVDEDEFGSIYDELDLDEADEAMLQEIEHTHTATLAKPNTTINFDIAAALDAATAAAPNNKHAENSEESFIQGGLGEGKSDDDCLPEDGGVDDESDDESDTNPKKKHHHIPLPTWLMDRYKQHVADCNDRDNATKRPPLYRQGHFWFPIKNNFFASESPSLKPSDFFTSRFFLWDPMCLLPPHSSLVCRCKQPLARMGAATRPRAMVGTEGVDYIIAFRYRCRNCSMPTAKKTGTLKSKSGGGKTSSYSSTSTHIMEQLPLHLAMEFPAILTH
jgi:hypothetical protein